MHNVDKSSQNIKGLQTNLGEIRLMSVRAKDPDILVPGTVHTENNR